MSVFLSANDKAARINSSGGVGKRNAELVFNTHAVRGGT